MTSFIAKVRERRAEITAQIAALVAERDELDAVDRVYVRLSGDGADIAGDEPADQSTAARKDVPEVTRTGQPDQVSYRDSDPVTLGLTDVGALGSFEPKPGAGTQAPPVDTPAPPATVAQTVTAHEPVATSPAGSDAVAIPATNLQHDAGDRADTDPRSLVGSSNSPEGASDVAAGRARKPSVDPGAEPVRQAGGNASAAGKPAGVAGASPAAPSIVSRLRALNAEHPEFTAAQAAEALGITKDQAKSNSYVNRIKWASPSHRGDNPVATCLKDRIIALHREHPDWADDRIAAAVGCGAPYVRTVAQRSGITLPSRRAAAEPAQPDPKPEAPEPIPEPERPPEVTAEPANGIPPAHAARPAMPKGRQFWLVNKAGLYLNRYCLGLTADRREAWTGNAMQVVACRRKFEIARDLSNKPVDKEQAAPINREVA